MPKLHIIEGPVGAGKTTFANQMGRTLKTPPLILDAWFVTLFRPDRPADGLWDWYADRKQRCVAQISDMAVALIAAGHDTIVELGLIRQDSRMAYYAQIEALDLQYTVHVLDAPKAQRQARVRKRNTERGATYAMDVSDEIFAVASDMWEPPDAAECAGRDVRFIRQADLPFGQL